MHEVDRARAIVAAIHEHDAPPDYVRIRVRGGHSRPDAFDAALRTHIVACDPGMALVRLEIAHLTASRMCASCGVRYYPDDPDAACPTCGGSAWAELSPEEVELEFSP